MSNGFVPQEKINNKTNILNKALIDKFNYYLFNKKALVYLNLISRIFYWCYVLLYFKKYLKSKSPKIKPNILAIKSKISTFLPE